MDLVDRMFFMLIGGCIGFVFGYIVRSLREIKDELHVDEHLEKKRNEKGTLKVPSLSSIALFIVVLLTAYAAFMSQRASDAVQQNVREVQIARCQASVEDRIVQRATIDAIYNLATGLVDRRGREDILTPEQIERYNLYVKQVNSFRDDLYKQIRPSNECLPYVEDDNVKPPTKPFPIIPMPKE